MNGVIAWASNSPTAATGYGTQTAQFLTHAKRAGYKVASLSNYGLEGTNSVWDSPAGPIPHYGRGTDLYSNDVIPLNSQHWANKNPGLPSCLITLYDAWVFDGIGYDKIERIGSWTPVDHSPLPEKVGKWLRRPNVTPIAMSKFGQDEMARVGIEAEYVPHGIDTKKMFKPTFVLPEGVSVEEHLQSKDKFVVGMNAANKGIYPMRKAWDANILAFSIFAQKHDDVLLYIHTEPFGVFGGVNLFDLMKACGLPQEKVSFVDPVAYRYGIDQETVAALYTGMDVLLAPSLGEGFGLATLEAQACGTRVIGSNFAATAELVSEDGWLVNGQPLWDAPQKAWFNMPFVIEIVNALEEAYQKGKGRSQKAISKAAEYDSAKVFKESWQPVLGRLLGAVK
jgi:glycosyltransferase involved in cell wall biosynthesis